MRSVDVNVLLHAAFTGSSEHASAVACLEQCRRAEGGLSVFSQVAASFIRLATDPRVYEAPLAPEQAIGFLEVLLVEPGGRIVQPGQGHWARFTELVVRHELRRGGVTDAWLAAAAMDTRAEWYSYDQGFARFSGLRWVDPRAA